MIEVKDDVEPVTTQSKVMPAPEKLFSGLTMEALLTEPFTATAKGIEELKESKELEESEGLKGPLLSFNNDK